MNIYSSVMCLMFLTSTAVNADDWIISGDNDDLEMKQRYGDDYTNRYKGSRDDDGYTTLRNRSSGEKLRGYIDDDGYGSLRDDDGNRVRIRPD